MRTIPERVNAASQASDQLCENKAPTGLTVCLPEVCEAHRSAGPSTAACGLSFACR